MNTFQTHSTAQKSVRTLIFTFIPMFALAFLGLKVAVATWLFFELILVLTFGFCLLFTARTHWEIQFKGDSLHLYNTGNRQSYTLDQLRQSDFIIQQTEKQKTKNACDMKIANAPFVFSDVQACNQLLSYIRENFPT